jgi:flagellar hook assembly protein FlgD
VPVVFALMQNQPNPFDRTTKFRFDLPQRTRVRLEIFDLQGRRVRVMANAAYEAGRWSVDWDRRDAAGSLMLAGIYLYRLEAGPFRSQRKMVLLP